MEDFNDASVRHQGGGGRKSPLNPAKSMIRRTVQGRVQHRPPIEDSICQDTLFLSGIWRMGFPLWDSEIGGRLGWGCPEGENKAGGKGGEIFALVVIGGGGNLTSQGTDKSNLDSSRAYKIFTYFSILTVRNFLLYISA